MKVERVGIETLTEDSANTRRHSDENLQAIRRSLVRFGQVEPLVVQVGTGLVIGGNGRLAAMHDLGWEKVDVVFVEKDDDEARALAIALNRTAELADWNRDVLIEALRGFDTETALDAGWSPEIVAQLLAQSPVSLEGDGGMAAALAGLGEGGSGYRLMTFNLTDDQYEEVEGALRTLSESSGVAALRGGVGGQRA